MARARHASAFARYVFKRFIEGQGFLNVSALTYTTLFAVVPVLMVMYSALSVLPLFEGVSLDMQAFIFSHFLPSSSQAVQEYLAGFADQARRLTAVGVVFLLLTAYMTLRTIEQTFNRIWGVVESRKGVASFLLYWAVLTLGPMLFGAAFAISSYIATLPFLTDVSGVAGRYQLLQLLPWLLSWGAFTLLYWAVPNCSVPVRHAMWGGLLTALLFNIAKAIFTFYVKQFPSYQLIYGAFAVIPLFLLWIYLSWLIVLLGGHAVRAMATFNLLGLKRHPAFITMAFVLLERLWIAQKRGEAVSEEQMQKHLPAEALEELLDMFQQCGFIIRSESGGWLLSRDLHALPMYEVLEALPFSHRGELPGNEGYAWEAKLSAMLLQWRGQWREQMALPVTALLEESERTDESVAGHVSESLSIVKEPTC
ncbi:YihY family inner membrane protein [Pokkaliibacter sp. CJK22405]|uniref:YihY family inner membrane protein n=1 Tax=Pokkaliibacter sp. CJK22405 TaxID=3384615 RepID=UPI003984B968